MIRLAIIGLVVLFFSIGCGKKNDTFIENADSLNFSNATYVGKESCGSCHGDKLETFVHSEMGRSFKVATLSNSQAKWDNVKPIHDKDLNFSYLPYHNGEDLFILEFRIKGKDTVYKRIEKVNYIVGSGQHTNSHIREENGRLYQIPLTWYAQDKKWDLPPGFEKGENSRFSRMIEMECMTCHNAMPEFEKGSANKFKMIPHGIDCERCHGPGSAHVQRMKTGNKTDTNGKPTTGIIHPGKINNDLQFDICQRCHLQGAALLAPGKAFQDFVPGMRLSEVMDVFFLRKSDSLERFIMASHPDRLRQSQCFIKSQGNPGSMTCITCHDPHKSIASLGADHYKSVCQSCHNERKEKLCSEKISVRKTKMDNCVKCHMPVSGSSDIPHVKITDHFIRQVKKISKDQLEKEKAYLKLVCRTQDNPPAIRMAEGYLAYYEQFNPKRVFLDSAIAWLNKAKPVTEEKIFFPVWVRYLYVSSQFEEIAKISSSKKPGDEKSDWTAYRIAEALYQSGEYKKSLDWYAQAKVLAPANPGFNDRFATALIKANEIDRAITILDELILSAPSYTSAWNQRGFAFVKKGDLHSAESDFRKALALDPDLELALANLSSLLINTNRFREAGPYVKELLKRDPGNPGYKKLQSALRL